MLFCFDQAEVQERIEEVIGQNLLLGIVAIRHHRVHLVEHARQQDARRQRADWCPIPRHDVKPPKDCGHRQLNARNVAQLKATKIEAPEVSQEHIVSPLPAQPPFQESTNSSRATEELTRKGEKTLPN